MIKKPVQILFGIDAKRTMLHLSKKMNGCYRPEVGSINHFVVVSCIEKMLRMGIKKEYVVEMFDLKN